MPSKEQSSPKTQWLITWRQWHTWLGLIFALLILVLCVTGILLNHKAVFFQSGEVLSGPVGRLRTSSDLTTIPIAFDKALEMARERYGDVVLEKIELKEESGRLIYKVSRGKGEEVIIDAYTGDMISKRGLSQTGNVGAASLNWPKIVKDLHTGSIGGSAGKGLMDLTAIILIVLTVSGIYLWAVPRLRRRKRASPQAK